MSPYSTTTTKPKRKNVFSSFLSALYYISSVGNFEARILWRSWLFRVFSILILAILVLFDLFGVLGIAGANAWPGRNLPGNIVYMNFFLFTIAQVIIAAFLSADFLGRERKMDTTEVFYTRPMSNFQYVLGKTWGAMMVFGGLNLLVIILSMVVTLLTPDTPFALSPFLFFLVVYSLPSLIFILGFSYVLMVLVRNQAVTFVLVLGFGATVLFYLENMHWGVWDFMGFFLPVHYSGFTGFSDLYAILEQRGGYVLLGCTGIVLTTLFLPRLPGGKRRSPALIGIAVLSLLVSGSFFYGIIDEGRNGLVLREEIRNNEGGLPDLPEAQIDSCFLDVKHIDNSLDCDAHLKISLFSETDSLKLALNSGFSVTAVAVNGGKAEFDHKSGILNIDITGGPGKMHSEITCRISYSGSPLNKTIYPFVDEEKRQMLSRFDPLVANKKYAFVESEFILLTSESGWYPKVAWKNYRQQPDFTNYKLTFNSENNLKAFSQGKSVVGDSMVEFINDQPLNALTLVAGRYSSSEIVVDSIKYQLATNVDNNLIANNFDQVADTIPSLIRNLKNQYERRLKLEYPFRRLKVIEVPVHFYSWLQPWRSGTDHIQPEMILLPEYGTGKWFLDINRTRNDFEEEAEQKGEEPLEEEVQARMFVTLAGNAFLFPRWQLFQSINERNMDEWNRIQVYPLYFFHAYQIREKGWPVFQIMLDEAIRSKSRKEFGNSWRQENDQYKGHLALKNKSLHQWLNNKNAGDTIARILNLTGVQFFAEISSASDEKDFIDRMHYPLKNYAFQRSSPAQWLNAIETPGDPEKKYRELIQKSQLPAFKFGTVQTSELRQKGKSQYMVSLPVDNEGWSDGVLDMQVTFLDLSENRGRSFSQWMYQNVENEENVALKTYVVPARSKVRIDMVYDELPRELEVNTGVARNIPPFYSFTLENFEYKGQENIEEGVFNVDSIVERSDEQNTFIVDNEDPGFLIDSRDEIRTLKDWWIQQESEKVKDYVRFRHWSPQPVWISSLGDKYFGEYLRSASLKASGNGEDRARWTGRISESGSYEVQVYIPVNLDVGWRNRNSKGSFKYTVFHANGKDEVDTPPVRERNGWVSLGRFYLDEGDAVVELSDKSDFPYVVADAVKWIKN
ncbi:golvesin C-terminal-like domain-containing protein [Marinilabilia rubra]|uniref:Golvesin/Xly CBD-like domain-containing protein n=1 Tax=Marinilabilia rubra TaxID=2162893 RepID=A0A2U2B3J5_9BACT|nr:hypothetical protein [Marinilabilia rubra]PWD97630.1 hypothetical protein DDZ16_19785 [Marinilabilia rubra]